MGVEQISPVIPRFVRGQYGFKDVAAVLGDKSELSGQRRRRFPADGNIHSIADHPHEKGPRRVGVGLREVEATGKIHGWLEHQRHFREMELIAERRRDFAALIGIVPAPALKLKKFVDAVQNTPARAPLDTNAGRPRKGGSGDIRHHSPR